MLFQANLMSSFRWSSSSLCDHNTMRTKPRRNMKCAHEETLSFTSRRSHVKKNSRHKTTRNTHLVLERDARVQEGEEERLLRRQRDEQARVVPAILALSLALPLLPLALRGGRGRGRRLLALALPLGLSDGSKQAVHIDRLEERQRNARQGWQGATRKMYLWTQKHRTQTTDTKSAQKEDKQITTRSHRSHNNRNKARPHPARDGSACVWGGAYRCQTLPTTQFEFA